jgi:hypothetical protein
MFHQGRGGARKNSRTLPGRNAGEYSGGRPTGPTGGTTSASHLMESAMKFPTILIGVVCAMLPALLISAESVRRSVPVPADAAATRAAEGQTPAGTSGAAATSKPSPPEPAGSRGQRLMLKDGNFQLVRTYQRNGERVRYLSAERGDWEELPASMVDWDATAKAAADDARAENALVKTVHQQQVESSAQVPTDVDASLRVGAGVFLPSGEGMFAVQGKSVVPLEQVTSQNKLDKKRAIEKVISPAPALMPSKHNIVLEGAHAKLRVVGDGNPLEFFLREPPPDRERVSPILKSSAAGDSGPEVELVMASVRGSKRQIESISSRFGETMGVNKKVISVQRWDVAPDVYRFTLSEPLPPGEYVLAEILPDGLNLFVWDFGVDVAGQISEGASKH